MSSAVSSSPSDELLELLVRELGTASDTRLAGKDAHKQLRDDAQQRQHAAEPLGSVKSEPPDGDDLDAEANSSNVSMTSNRQERCSLVNSDVSADDEPTSGRILPPTASVHHNKQLPAPTVGLTPDSTDSRQSEQQSPQTIPASRTNGGRSNRVTDQPVEAMCDICGQRFAKESHLDIHYTIHTGEKPHECPECGRRFRQLQSVKMHMMSHTGERPFVCEHCGQGHRTAGHLARHTLVHTGERPHACKFCPKKYYDAWTLRNHERSHTGERPFACDRCDKRFIRRSHLQRHELIHLAAKKPFQCGVCGQCLSNAKSLKLHTARLHSAEPSKMNYCDECGDSFSTPYSLRVHTVRVHAGKSAASK